MAMPESVGRLEADREVRGSEVAAVIGKGQQGLDADAVDRRLESAPASGPAPPRSRAECRRRSAPRDQVQRRQRDGTEVQVQRQIDFQLRAAVM